MLSVIAGHTINKERVRRRKQIDFHWRYNKSLSKSVIGHYKYSLQAQKEREREREVLSKLMEVEDILRMNGGVGQSSYANNCVVQRIVITKAELVLEETIRELHEALKPKCLMLADMGCSSGPNAFLVLSKIMQVINEVSQNLNKPILEFGVFLNDLPGNDFNALLQFLPSFYKQIEEENGRKFGPCFVSATPKSFYGRVFPTQFLHFVHSSFSLHWLSQVPKGLVTNEGVALNKGNIHIAKTSPPDVQKEYYKQFEMDFTLFLRSRASEVVPGGRMVLTFQGSIQSNNPNPIFEPLGSALHDMVLEGVIDEEKLDMFNMPCYFPTVEEVKHLVEAEGSFTLSKLETFTVDWSGDETQNLRDRVEFVVKSIRSVMESLFTNAFGKAAMDDLFLRFEHKVEEPLARQRSQYFNLLISLARKA